jgi:DNA-binding MarR family transcriptional regulator
MRSMEGGRADELAADLRAVIGQVSRRLREQASAGELTWSQTAVLGRLEREGPATVTGLAKAAGMRPQSMGANVAALEAAGLISGAPDPSDGRQTLFSLTDRCRDWIQASRTAKEDWLSRAIRTRFSPEELQDIGKAATLLRRLAEP